MPGVLSWKYLLVPLVLAYGLATWGTTVFPGLSQLSSYDFANQVLSKLIRPVNDPPTTPIVYSTADLAWAARLRDNWEVIRDELNAFEQNYTMPLLADMSPAHNGVDEEKGWRSVPISVYGWKPRWAELFPNTLRLLDESGAPWTLAMFSLLEGNKYISPHKGYYSGLLRYHLGLEVPPHKPDELGLWVHDKGSAQDPVRLGWSEGGDLLFDDTATHFVENRTPHRRVVLFVDIEMQDLGSSSAVWRSWLNRLVLRFAAAYLPDVTQIVKNADRQYAAMLERRRALTR